MTERGFPFAMAQVLDINTASLQNLKKQNFEVFNQYSVYEHTLPLPEINNPSTPSISVREINRTDRTLFKEIGVKTTPRSVLSVKGSAEALFCLDGKDCVRDLPDIPGGSKRWMYRVKRSDFCARDIKIGSKAVMPLAMPKARAYRYLPIRQPSSFRRNKCCQRPRQ
jgi:hypothetical protein